MSNQARGTVEMVAAMAIAGTIGWIVQVSSQSIFALVFWRCAFGAIALAVVWIASGAARGDISLATVLLTALGGVAIVLNWLMLFAAFPLASISVATAVYSVQPFVLVILGALFLGEKVTTASLVWLGVAFVGVIAITQADSAASLDGSNYLLGIGLAFGAAAAYAVAAVLAKKLRGVPPILVTLIQVCVGMVIVAPWVNFSQAPEGAVAWGQLVALGAIYTGLMFALQYAAIQRLPTRLIGSLYFIYPLVAILVDMLVFGHRLQLWEGFGIGAILLGAAGINLGWGASPVDVNQPQGSRT